VQGSVCYGMEEFEGQRVSSMDIALQLMADGRVNLEPLITHSFQLEDYASAFETVLGKSRSGVIKAVFEFDPDQQPTI
jgi:L-iditol 2-dehydrogenase